MLQVWLRTQYSPLLVWHPEVKQWHAVEGWQQLYDIYGSKTTQPTVTLYYPSQHVLQYHSSMRAPQLKQLGHRGQQYLFEEVSIRPVEQLQVRHISDAGRQLLYALDEGDIDAWQQSAALVGMRIVALLPDFLLLPVPASVTHAPSDSASASSVDARISWYEDPYTQLIRQSAYQGVAVSYLPRLLEQLPDLQSIDIVSSIDATVDSGIDPVADMQLDSADIGNGASISMGDHAQPVQHKRSITKALVLAPDDNASVTQAMTSSAGVFKAHQLITAPAGVPPTPLNYPERHALNFARHSGQSTLHPYLRMAAMVALAALLLQMVTDGLQWYRYDQASIVTQQASAAQYQSWFDGERLNPRTQLRTAMAPKLRSDTQAPAAHMAALARISPLIKQSSVQAQRLSMAPSSLSFTLTAPERRALDQFTSTLNEQGLSARLDRVSSNEQGQFSGEMTIMVNEGRSS